jgi:hypothetical protein
VKLFVLPEVECLSGGELMTNRMHEVLKSNCLIPIVVKVFEHLINLRFRQFESPVFKVELKLFFFNTYVSVLVKVSKTLGGRFPVLPYLRN